MRVSREEGDGRLTRLPGFPTPRGGSLHFAASEIPIEETVQHIFKWAATAQAKHQAGSPFREESGMEFNKSALIDVK
jgi:hypothetical protein